LKCLLYDCLFISDSVNSTIIEDEEGKLNYKSILDEIIYHEAILSDIFSVSRA